MSNKRLRRSGSESINFEDSLDNVGNSDSDSSTRYEIEKIVGHRIRKNK
jgi:hypothetical protein